MSSKMMLATTEPSRLSSL